MDRKESGPLETFVGEKGVEKHQGERLKNFALFSCVRGWISVPNGTPPVSERLKSLHIGQIHRVWHWQQGVWSAGDFCWRKRSLKEQVLYIFKPFSIFLVIKRFRPKFSEHSMLSTRNLRKVNALVCFFYLEFYFWIDIQSWSNETRAIFHNFFFLLFGSFLITSLLFRRRLRALHFEHDRSNLHEGRSFNFWEGESIFFKIDIQSRTLVKGLFSTTFFKFIFCVLFGLKTALSDETPSISGQKR
jgi:hypothetical protein